MGTVRGQRNLLMQNGHAAGLSRGRMKTSESSSLAQNPLGFHFL